MRTSDDPNLSAALFESDLPKGGVQIKCGKCRFVFYDFSKPEEPSICPNCKTELFYRSWFIW